MSINTVIIIGYLGNDPELISFQSGDCMTKISVATSERWTDRNTGKKMEKTEWHRIVFFNSWQAQTVFSEFKKGDLIYIEGSLRTRQYQDDNNQTRYSTEIVAKLFYKLP